VVDPLPLTLCRTTNQSLVHLDGGYSLPIKSRLGRTIAARSLWSIWKAVS
jgi:hypothetical protein